MGIVQPIPPGPSPDVSGPSAQPVEGPSGTRPAGSRSVPAGRQSPLETISAATRSVPFGDDLPPRREPGPRTSRSPDESSAFRLHPLSSQPNLRPPSDPKPAGFVHLPEASRAGSHQLARGTGPSSGRRQSEDERGREPHLARRPCPRSLDEPPSHMPSSKS